MTTERQKKAVNFCEEVLGIDFNGNINNYTDVGQFLKEYLQEAKNCYHEIASEYDAFMWELD